MFPIRDENPSGVRPTVTYALIIVNTVVFLWELAYGLERAVYDFGFIPALFLADPLGNAYRIFTSMFLHGGWSHLIGNMVYLYIFGDNVEAAFGKARYFAFYLASGVGATGLHVLASLTPPAVYIPAVGASGAISGVLGAYWLFYPHARIQTVVTYGFFWQIVRIPAYYYIGFWFVYQLIMGALGISGVAWWAHVGGFVTGLVLGSPLKRAARRRREVLRRRYWDYYVEWY